jgi:2,4-dienoyl-CoA reductase-like NADH-dependent reductase (Old Yellow Enzyme family)
MFEQAGVDLLEISGGTYEQPKLIGADNISINPDRSEVRKESTIAREAYFLDYAAKIRAAVEMPLMVTGGFRTREGMEKALRVESVRLWALADPCAQTLIV